MKLIFTILIIFLNGAYFAQNIVETTLSECDIHSQPQFQYPNRLIKKEFFNDTLLLKIGVVRNCGLEPEIKCYQNKDSLFITIKNTSDVWVACDCCFELDLKIAEIIDSNFTLYMGRTEIKKLHNKFIFPSLREIENNQEINQFNADSLKIGLWHYYADNSIRIKAKEYYFIDEFGKSRSKWTVLYNDEGKLDSICAFTSVDSNGISNSTCADRKQYLDLKIEEP